MAARLALAAALLLTGAAAEEDVWRSPPQRADGMTARLEVQFAEATAAAPVTLRVIVDGPKGLQVETHVGDVGGAWEMRRSASTAPSGDGVTYTEEIRLSSARPGTKPLPSVSVRFRSGPEAPWHKAEWTEPLKEPRPGPEPELLPTPTPTLRQWWRVLVFTIGGTLLVVVALEVLRRRRRRSPPTLAERTLADLGRLDIAADGFAAELARLLRRFIGESEGLPAHERTTAELLAALADLPNWPEERRERLGGVLRRCDLALYAAASAPEEERRADLERARAVVADEDASPTMTRPPSPVL